jgi:hypothetical protein
VILDRVDPMFVSSGALCAGANIGWYEESAFRCPPISKIDLCAAIRRDGMSGRALAGKYKVSRCTGRAASVWPQPRKPLPPRASKLDAFKPVIEDARSDTARVPGATAAIVYSRLLLIENVAGRIADRACECVEDG